MGVVNVTCVIFDESCMTVALEIHEQRGLGGGFIAPCCDKQRHAR
jgi:hypothetical protein